MYQYFFKLTYYKQYTLLFIILIFSYKCKTDNHKTEIIEKENVTTKSIEIPSFNDDSAYKFVEKQVSFGPRVPGTKASDECANYLSKTLDNYGASVIVQKTNVRVWDGKVLPVKNIIGSWLPKNKNRIMLCSHWDSRPYSDWDEDINNHNKPIDGANDGASGVGVLLEVARNLSLLDPNIGIDIIFFDVEDYGKPKSQQSRNIIDDWALGSQYWAKNNHIPGYYAKYGILLDMVGGENPTFYREGYSMQYAKNIVNKVWDIAYNLGYGDYFSQEISHHITDDHYYINVIAGIPTIDIIHQDKSSQTGFFKHWHTQGDNIKTSTKKL